jgi:hypothetical protein
MSDERGDFEPLFRAHFSNRLFDFSHAHGAKINLIQFGCNLKSPATSSKTR